MLMEPPAGERRAVCSPLGGLSAGFFAQLALCFDPILHLVSRQTETPSMFGDVVSSQCDLIRGNLRASLFSNTGSAARLGRHWKFRCSERGIPVGGST